MRICENGIYRDMTPEEVTTVEAQARLAAIAERSRPMTEQEVSRLLIAQQINTLTVDDNTALRMKDFYPEWIEGVSYEPGFKVHHNGKLWRAIQAHTSQSTWEPENVTSLWEVINETHSGTIDDPIPYNGNMTLNLGKYYIQNNRIYLCHRDTINPVYNSLYDLINIYVDII